MSDLFATSKEMTQLAEAFDTDRLVLSAYTDAKNIFEQWAAIGPGELPEDPIDAMQVLLMRWQRNNFGDQPDERMALGVIEELFEADTALALPTSDDVFDALGDVMVYGSQLLTNNRLAIRPLTDLAVVIDPDIFQLNIAPGMLAQTVLKGMQKIRGLDDLKRYHVRLVGCIGLCFRRCQYLVHRKWSQTTVNYPDVFLRVGGEVVQRGEGHDAIPKLTVH